MKEKKKKRKKKEEKRKENNPSGRAAAQPGGLFLGSLRLCSKSELRRSEPFKSRTNASFIIIIIIASRHQNLVAQRGKSYLTSFSLHLPLYLNQILFEQGTFLTDYHLTAN
jgi:hypothetical protein